MIVRIKTETFFNVEMTAQQRKALILGLLNVSENNPLDKEQKEVIRDLRVSLLNAA